MAHTPNDYLLVWYFSQQYNEGAIPSHFMTRSEEISALESAIFAAGASLPHSEICDAKWLANYLFDEFRENDLLPTEIDPIAGAYFHLDLKGIGGFRNKYLQDSPIFARLQKVGTRLIPDALSAYKEMGANPSDHDNLDDSDIVPASDRLVTLNDNQISEIHEPIDEIIDQMEAHNGDPDDVNFRSRVIGQLKAGRELVRVGVFKYWLFEQTLLNAIGELIQKYAGSALGIAAAKLLEMLLEKIFRGE